MTSADENTDDRAKSSPRDPKRDEMIRDAAPHPESLIFNSVGYEWLEPGRWRFVVPDDGWYEDVVHALWMGGYTIRRVRGDEPEADDGLMTVDLVEEEWHSHSVCPACGEFGEPEFIDEGVRCPECGEVA